MCYLLPWRRMSPHAVLRCRATTPGASAPLSLCRHATPPPPPAPPRTNLPECICVLVETQCTAHKSCADTDTAEAGDQAFTTCDAGFTIKSSLPTAACADQSGGCVSSDCCDGLFCLCSFAFVSCSTACYAPATARSAPHQPA